jgi:uroporphyrinogen decarboxylase
MNSPIHIASQPLLKVLLGQTTNKPPVWFMRQAGRYLPEYKALRLSCPDFVSFCLDPQKAAEATLQPIRRFGFDAAILFSDILMIPMALGQALAFETGEGPVLGPLPNTKAMLLACGHISNTLAPIGQTVLRVKSELSHTPLIGFCGGPWTVMTYMLNGKKAQDRSLVRAFVYDQPHLVASVMDIVIEASAQYLKLQADKGADVLKIFESWAEGIPDPYFDQLVIKPHQKLVERVRQLGVNIPIIGFPRGAEAQLMHYIDHVPVDALALGTATPLELGQNLQKRLPIQGALDPVVLRSGGEALDRAVKTLREAWGQGPYIFNLGHGIFPDTPIAHVEQTLALIRA